MNYTKYRFNLDMQSHISQISLPVRQRDTGISLYISLTDGGVPYSIKDGCRAVFNAKKADGNPIMNDCTILRNTLIEYKLTEQTTACSGVVDCEIRLYGTDGHIITSPRFIMVVDERVVHDEDIPLSDSEMSAIDNIFSSENARIEAEEARVAAEEIREETFNSTIKKIEETDAKVNDLLESLKNTEMGAIDTELDNIIEIQENLIGGV